MKIIKNIIRRIISWTFKEELSQLQELRERETELRINQFQLKNTVRELVVLRDRIALYNELIERNRTQESRIKNLLDNLDISVDVHEYSPSWAAICIQGEKTDFIKFVDLGRRDAYEISQFLKRFDRKNVKIDANPFICANMKDELHKL